MRINEQTFSQIALESERGQSRSDGISAVVYVEETDTLSAGPVCRGMFPDCEVATGAA